MQRKLGDVVTPGRRPPERELRRNVGERCPQVGTVPGPRSVSFLDDPREHPRIQPGRNRCLGFHRNAHAALPREWRNRGLPLCPPGFQVESIIRSHRSEVLAKIALEVERAVAQRALTGDRGRVTGRVLARGEGWTVEDVICTSGPQDRPFEEYQDRKSTRLNSSHRCISYAVFCL